MGNNNKIIIVGLGAISYLINYYILLIILYSLKS